MITTIRSTSNRYEFAEDKEQQWKEGHTVLEVAYLRGIGQICFDNIPILQ